MPQPPAGQPERVTEDRLFGGRLLLLQPARGHRAGTDAVLLAAATPPDAARIADLGAASGIVGLRAAQIAPAARVLLVERDPALVALAEANIARNGLAARVAARAADILALGRAPDLREGFDLVLTNPPFLEAGRARVSDDARRAEAHVLDGDLEGWLRAAATLLAPRGRLVLIHRADALPALIRAAGRRFGGLRLRFIHPIAEGAAIRVLMTGIKGSRAPLAVLPPLVLHGAGGAFTPEAAALHAGAAAIEP
jgi:tRNA1(Val) A37 N6-methylase TrmN6